MKKSIFLLMIIYSLMILSCGKDDDLTPDDLAGTKWLTDDKETGIIFTSKNEVTYEYYDSGSTVFSDDGFYSVVGNNITLDFSGYVVTGVRDGNSITFIDDGWKFIVKKQ